MSSSLMLDSLNLLHVSAKSSVTGAQSGSEWPVVDAYVRLSILGIILGMLCGIAVIVYETYSQVPSGVRIGKSRSSVDDMVSYVWHKRLQKRGADENGCSGGTCSPPSSSV